MADATIDIVGQDDLPLLVSLYDQIFRPACDPDQLRRVVLTRDNPLSMVARLNDQPVGFYLGHELEPGLFWNSFCGVAPDHRRQGVAAQLLEAVHEWAKLNDYETVRGECRNQHRPMLHLLLERGYEIVGVRYDAGRADQFITFEKVLT